MTRPPISVCVVAMNEEDNIADCLKSADFGAEIIVVDSHSTDATRDIAARAGARVIERDWPGFVEQKNFAIEQATNEWVFCIDADERVSPELRASILAALERPDLPDGFEMPRLTWYLGRWIRRGGWYPDRKVRLVRRGKAKWGGVNPHDHLYVQGRVERLDGDLLHYAYPSISAHVKTIDSYTTIMARGKFAAGKRAGLADITLRPFGKFLRMYVLKRGFLEGAAGFIVAATGAFYVFLKYAKLRELQRGDGRDGR